jgi:DNA-binding MarR family transcriptional regulator
MSKPEQDDVNYNALSLVARSQYRQLTVEELAGGPSTPSEIARQTNNDMSPISRALCRLRDEGVVELLVEEETKKGRYYALTQEGRNVLKALGEEQ